MLLPMKISCVIVSYNNGELLRRAILSVVEQTHPVDEIIVPDDGSTDGSRQLIEALSHNHTNIKPIFREKNLGVSANRDLAMRGASGDYITYLDGDDYFLPTKIEAEARALQGHAEVIAYSDFRLVDRSDRRTQKAAIADFARLGASDRIRWLLKRAGWSPSAMLVSKEVHLRIGGYNHSLRTWEDWDYSLRLAAQPLRWAHSGTEGHVLHIGSGGGLSNQRSIEHMRDELRVLRLNHEIARRHVGLPLLLATAGKVVVFRSKWVIVPRYRRMRGRLRE
jgi:glycosyltransferase involved in cell wall biosynthesis